MHLAFIIYVLAFAALIMDVLTAVLLGSLGTYYLLADCPYAGTQNALWTLRTFCF